MQANRNAVCCYIHGVEKRSSSWVCRVDIAPKLCYALAGAGLCAPYKAQEELSPVIRVIEPKPDVWQYESARAKFRLGLSVFCETFGDEERDPHYINRQDRRSKNGPHQVDYVASAIVRVGAFGAQVFKMAKVAATCSCVPSVECVLAHFVG